MPSGIYQHKKGILKHTEEWKKKASERMRDNKYFLGHRHSERTKRKIKESLMGEKNPNFGKLCSEETKRKMREAQIGKPKWTEKDKKRISEQGKGNKHHLGKHHSLEIRKKLSLMQKGENGSNWKGGITPLNKRLRYNIEFRLWREAVFARDNWTCQKYGIKGGELHPHHIQNFAQYPELRFAINNGITLSEKAHKEFHKKYGVKNNTKEQLNEFLAKH